MLLALPFLFSSVIDAQTDDYTMNFAGVTTGAGAYAANVTLDQDLYDDNAVSVSSISSNFTSDTPSANAYNSVSGVLTVGGLEQSATRTLSVTMDIDSPSLPDGMSVFMRLIMWFLIVVLLGLLIGAVYAFFQS